MSDIKITLEIREIEEDLIEDFVKNLTEDQVKNLCKLAVKYRTGSSMRAAYIRDVVSSVKSDIYIPDYGLDIYESICLGIQMHTLFAAVVPFKTTLIKDDGTTHVLPGLRDQPEYVEKGGNIKSELVIYQPYNFQDLVKENCRKILCFKGYRIISLKHNLEMKYTNANA